MVPKQGTDIGAAIDLGMRSFSPGEGKSKAMIIITDGENHEDDPVARAGRSCKSRDSNLHYMVSAHQRESLFLLLLTVKKTI